MVINDICKVSTILKFVTFADDTDLLCSVEDMKELLKTLERELIVLKKWFAVNMISPNENKVYGVRWY